MIKPIAKSLVRQLIDLGQDAPPSLTYEQMVLATSPARYYRFGETSGTAIVDEISAKNGVYIGPYTLGEPSLLASGDDLSVDWNGSSDPTIPQDSDFNVGTGDFTVMFLYKANSAIADSYFLDLRHADSDGWFIITGGAGPTITGSLRYSNTVSFIVNSTTVIDGGGTFHCVIRRQSGTVTAWVNGTNEDSASDATSYTRATGGLSLAHTSFGGNRLDGRMDELCYYNKALTDSEISAFAAKAL